MTMIQFLIFARVVSAIVAFTCSDIREGVTIYGTTLTEFNPTGGDMMGAGQCCDACAAAPGCDSWKLREETATCTLMYLWTYDKGSRSNYRGSCKGRVNMGFSTYDVEVTHTSLRGSTDELRDQQCCDECTQHPSCEGWWTVKQECYLYKFSQMGIGYKAGFAPGGHALPIDNQTCSDIREDVTIYGETLDEFIPTGGDMMGVGQCCDACAAAPGCDSWKMREETGTCTLMYLWKDDEGSRSNYRGSCNGRVNTGFSTYYIEVAQISLRGSTDELRDQQCCDECTQHPSCEGWWTVEQECYLYKFSEMGIGYKAGFAPGGHVIPTKNVCNVLAETYGRGKTIAKHNLRTNSQEDQDDECCNYCAQTHTCEFWVRSTIERECWTMAEWTSNAIWESEWRTGFKVSSVAEPIYCTAISAVWNLVGRLLRNVTFSVPAIGFASFQVDFPTKLRCPKLNVQNGKLVGALDDVTIAAHVTADNLLGVSGNVDLYVGANPDVVLDFTTCKVEGLRTNIWDLGLGGNLYNYSAHERLFKSMSAKYQFGLKHRGCGNLLKAYPTWEGLYGETLESGEITLTGVSQEINNAECCSRCLDNDECDAFETSGGGGHTCWLLSLWYRNTGHYRGNWKYNSTGQPSVWGRGREIGEYFVFGDTQEDRDRECAEQCAEADECDMWFQNTENRKCFLQSARYATGTLNDFRWIVNWILDGVITHLLNGVLKRSCEQKSNIEEILERFGDWRSWGVIGSGEVSWVADNTFWNAHDLLKTNTSWESVQLPLGASRLDFHAENSLLSDLVNLLITDLKGSFGNTVGEQFATPMAWFIGGLLQACIANHDKCPTKPPVQVPLEVFV